MKTHTCDWCGQILKETTIYRKGYQGQDWTEKGFESHAQPRDCIKFLAKKLK